MCDAGLQPNEAYTFAVAAYDAEHQLISDLGQSAGPIAALLPLPVYHLWCHLALTAAQLGMIRISRLGAATVLPHFITMQPDCPVWEANPLDQQSLNRSVRLGHACSSALEQCLSILHQLTAENSSMLLQARVHIARIACNSCVQGHTYLGYHLRVTTAQSCMAKALMVTSTSSYRTVGLQGPYGGSQSSTAAPVVPDPLCDMPR